MKKSEKYATGGIITAPKVGYLRELHSGCVFPNPNEEIQPWCSSTVYYPGDKVKHKNICYVSKDKCNIPDGANSNINNLPGGLVDKYWEKMYEQQYKKLEKEIETFWDDLFTSMIDTESYPCIGEIIANHIAKQIVSELFKDKTGNIK